MLFVYQLSTDDDGVLTTVEQGISAFAQVLDPLEPQTCDVIDRERADIHCWLMEMILEGDGHRHACAYKTPEYTVRVCSIRNPKIAPKGISP